MNTCVLRKCSQELHEAEDRRLADSEPPTLRTVVFIGLNATLQAYRSLASALCATRYSGNK